MKTKKFDLAKFITFWANIVSALILIWLVASTVECATHSLDAISGSAYTYWKWNAWKVLADILPR